MLKKEKSGVTGIIQITVRDEKGRVTNKKTLRNIVVNTGLAGISSRITGAGSESAFTYLAVGTGTTTEDATDTALETELTDSGFARASATVAQTTTTTTNDSTTLDYTWTATADKAITEVGAFNAGSGGTLLGHKVFSAINVTSGSSLEIIYKFIIARA